MPTHQLPYIDQKTADYYFNAFVDQPYSLLLHSSQASGHYVDWILIAPEQVVTSKLHSDGPDHRVLHFDPASLSVARLMREETVPNVASLINQWLVNYQSMTPKASGFTGGIAGAMAYDFGRQIERLPEQAATELELNDLCLGLYFCPIKIDHQQQQVTLYDNYQRSNTAAAILQRINEYTAANRVSQWAPFHLTSSWMSNMDQDSYREKFSQVQAYIHSGDCYQINLAQRFKAHYAGHPWQAFQYLAQQNQGPFSAYFNLGDTQILSLSPERFIAVADNHAITQPIKGTQPRSDDPQQDELNKQLLINSEKDQAENLMIVDLLRNDLSKTAAPGSVKVTELFGLYSFPSVHHLISTVEATIADGFSAFDVLYQSFPGGSITGAPKVRAMEIIEELEPHRRHFYCGSMVYLGFDGSMDSNIMIRTLITDQNTIYTWAGGGLVADSQCELEYQETFAKLSKILDPLSKLNSTFDEQANATNS